MGHITVEEPRLHNLLVINFYIYLVSSRCVLEELKCIVAAEFKVCTMTFDFWSRETVLRFSSSGTGNFWLLVWIQVHLIKTVREKRAGKFSYVTQRSGCLLSLMIKIQVIVSNHAIGVQFH